MESSSRFVGGAGRFGGADDGCGVWVSPPDRSIGRSPAVWAGGRLACPFDCASPRILITVFSGHGTDRFPAPALPVSSLSNFPDIRHLYREVSSRNPHHQQHLLCTHVHSNLLCDPQLSER